MNRTWREIDGILTDYVGLTEDGLRRKYPGNYNPPAPIPSHTGARRGDPPHLSPTFIDGILPSYYSRKHNLSYNPNRNWYINSNCVECGRFIKITKFCINSNCDDCDYCLNCFRDVLLSRVTKAFS